MGVNLGRKVPRVLARFIGANIEEVTIDQGFIH
jgi:hypothetical protein